MSKGFSYIGKEVQTSELRIDKDLYLDKSKATGSGKMNTPLVDSNGKVLVSPAAFASATALVDDAAAIPKTGFEAGKIFKITPTADRSKALPSTAGLLDAFGLTTFYQFVDIPVINLSSGFKLTITAGDGDTTFVGSNIILQGSSAFFRFVAQGTPVDAIIIYRLAGNSNLGVGSIVAGDGIDISAHTGAVTITAETATDSNPGAVELATTAETTTGTDTGRAVTPDGLKDGYQGSANVVTVGTIGTGTWRGTAIESSSMAAATSSAKGAVELATTAEADTGTDTDRAVTPAGLKSHVDARFSYQYIPLSMNITGSGAGNWEYASGNGIGNHLYNQDGGAGGTTASNTDGSASTITISKNQMSGGIIVPYDSVLVGFYAQTRSNNNSARGLGIFTGVPVWNDYEDATVFLRGAVQNDTSVVGGDDHYSIRPFEHSVLDINLALDAGDCIWMAGRDPAGASGGMIASVTIVLKTLMP